VAQASFELDNLGADNGKSFRPRHKSGDEKLKKKMSQYSDRL
jgi:hypothetical protein